MAHTDRTTATAIRASSRRPHPHRDPPATPAGVLLRHPLVLVAVLATSASLAVLAAWDDGTLLRAVDLPIQRWVEAHRTSFLGDVFRFFSRLGSNVLVFAVLGVLLVMLGRRCRALALVLAVSVLARPPLEYLVKEAVDRPRPDLEPLIPGTGPSHPSGHVLAAVALWGLLPPIIAALTRRRFWWWASTAVGGVFIAMIGMSRVYLGVHWTTDVVQSVLLGSIYLLGVEALFIWHHRRLPGCAVEAHLYEEPADGVRNGSVADETNVR